MTQAQDQPLVLPFETIGRQQVQAGDIAEETLGLQRQEDL